MYQSYPMEPDIMQKKTIVVWSLRLPSETPKRSLKAFVKTWKRSAVRSKTTWLSQILSDISKYSNINLSEVQEKDLESLEKICDDRKAWKQLTA